MNKCYRINIGLFCLIFSLAFNLCAETVIFQEHRPAKKYEDPQSDFLDGSVFKLYWPEIEPVEGKFNWEAFENDPIVLATKKRGKKLAVKIQLQGRIDKNTVPDWVKAKIVEGTDAVNEYANWPVFWDKNFQEKFENFLKGLAQRYDGDPYIEFFWFEETALGYPRAEKAWIKAGYTDVNIYKEYLVNRIKTYKKYFKKTPLMQMINKFRKSDEGWYKQHPEDITAMWEFADFLIKEGVYLGTPDFYQSEAEANNHDKNLIWPIFKKYQNKTKRVVFIDEPHAKKIKEPLLAVKNLFSSYRVDYIFLYPELAYDEKWQGALKYLKGKNPLYAKKDDSLGYGIFQKMHEKQLKETPTLNIENSYLLGAEFQISWSILEPEEKKFNWQFLDNLIKPWQRVDKKVIFAIFTVKKSGEEDDELNSATPKWVFTQGAKAIQTAVSPKLKKRKGKAITKEYPSLNWPIYWDHIYLEKYSSFISVLAARYDGHPAIEAIEIGLGNFGSMKAVVDEKLLKAYKNVGYTERLWLDTIKKIIDIYKSNFKKTPLIVRLGPLFKNQHAEYESEIKEIAHYAAERGIWLYQHNLTGTDKWLKKPYARIYNELHNKTKTLLGPDNPVSAESKENDEFYGEIKTVVENGFGGIRGIPKTYISYMIFYANDISAATKGSKNYNQKFEQAIKYVYDNLEKGD